MATALDVSLPGGLWADGERRRDAALRPLNGEDEAFLLEESAASAGATRDGTPRALPRAARAARARRGRGAAPSSPPATARRSSSHLRRLTFGERLQACSRARTCDEELDLDLRVGDLLVAPYERPPELDARDRGRAFASGFRRAPTRRRPPRRAATNAGRPWRPSSSGASPGRRRRRVAETLGD